MDIEPKQRSIITSLSYQVSKSPSPSPKYQDFEDQQIQHLVTDKHDKHETVSNIIVTTNYDTIAIPIKLMDLCTLQMNQTNSNHININTVNNKKQSIPNKLNNKQEPSIVNKKTNTNTNTNTNIINNKQNYINFPKIDFNILTRPNMTKRLPLRWRNTADRPVIITNVDLKINKIRHFSTYIKIEKFFNKVCIH